MRKPLGTQAANSKGKFYLHADVDEELFDAVVKVAKEQDRSLASFIRQALRKALAKQEE